jgi:hypothetical protein
MPSTEPNGAVDDEDRDRNVLNLMLADSPWPWSLDEIARELHSTIDASDAVARLTDAGLLHRLDGGFVFPTRAARRADKLGLGDA